MSNTVYRTSMSDLHIDIRELLETTDLPYDAIAARVGVPVQWVLDVAADLQREIDDVDYDDSTADAEALASAGWGTDEDYGSYDYE